MKYAVLIIGLIFLLPYFMTSATGPLSIACGYDRIGRAMRHMITLDLPVTDEILAREKAADSNCR